MPVVLSETNKKFFTVNNNKLSVCFIIPRDNKILYTINEFLYCLWLPDLQHNALVMLDIGVFITGNQTAQAYNISSRKSQHDERSALTLHHRLSGCSWMPSTYSGRMWCNRHQVILQSLYIVFLKYFLLRCDHGSYDGCWMGAFCMPEGSICPMACNTPAPSNCSCGEIPCDNGSYGGCWMGDHCMPEGSICPMACHTPAPSHCINGDVPCDMGTYGGCWMGDYCIAPGTVCPPACHSPAASQCPAGEIVCDMGSHAGCWNGDFCMPEGSECPPVCNTPAPSQCTEGQIMCDLGLDANYCWMGDYCMPAGSVCPAPAGIWSNKSKFKWNIYGKITFLLLHMFNWK